MKIVHVITRLIIGGAQENTLLTVEDQHRDYEDDVTLVSGPGLGPEGSLEERAHGGGFDFRIIPQMGRSIRPWSDWTSYRQIIDILRETRPEIVHTHSSKAGIMGRAAAAKLKIPVVHTIHGAAFHYGQSSLAHWNYRRAEKWAAQRCDHFISVCDAMTDQYVAAQIAEPDQFTTVYSGMDVEPFLNANESRDELRRRFGFTADHVVVGKVARLFPLKGHEHIVAAAPQIVDRNPNVRFLLVGDGILRPEFERQIAELGLTEHFVFTGLVPPDEVAGLIGAMDIVVHTSRWEGLARVLPQGLIAGKPVISFDIDGAREVVKPGETGYLVPAGTTDGLTEAVSELAGNAQLRDQMGTTGRDRFTDQFRHQTMTKRIREVYELVLSRSK